MRLIPLAIVPLVRRRQSQFNKVDLSFFVELSCEIKNRRHHHQ